MLKLATGGRAVVNFWFPLNSFSLLWPIDTILAVWVAYIKRQLGIATQMSVIKVKVTVIKNRKFCLITLVCLGPIDTKLGACKQCNQKNGIICFFTAIFHFLFLSHQYLVESLKTWFRLIAALLVFNCYNICY